MTINNSHLIFEYKLYFQNVFDYIIIQYKSLRGIANSGNPPQ